MSWGWDSWHPEGPRHPHLLGIGLHRRRWAVASEQSFICIYSCFLSPSELCLLSDQQQHSEIRSDQSLSRVQLFATPWIAAFQASLSINNSRSLLRLTSIKSATLDSFKRTNPTVNCTFQGYTLCAPHENHPETNPTPALIPSPWKKIIFHEIGSWCQKS